MRIKNKVKRALLTAVLGTCLLQMGGEEKLWQLHRRQDWPANC